MSKIKDYYHDEIEAMATEQHERSEPDIGKSCWLPASQAPYDTMCLFYTKCGNIVQGFIYDGTEEDYGYTHYMPLPVPPEDNQGKTSKNNT